MQINEEALVCPICNRVIERHWENENQQSSKALLGDNDEKSSNNTGVLNVQTSQNSNGTTAQKNVDRRRLKGITKDNTAIKACICNHFYHRSCMTKELILHRKKINCKICKQYYSLSVKRSKIWKNLDVFKAFLTLTSIYILLIIGYMYVFVYNFAKFFGLAEALYAWKLFISLSTIFAAFMSTLIYKKMLNALINTLNIEEIGIKCILKEKKTSKRMSKQILYQYLKEKTTFLSNSQKDTYMRRRENHFTQEQNKEHEHIASSSNKGIDDNINDDNAMLAQNYRSIYDHQNAALMARELTGRFGAQRKSSVALNNAGTLQFNEEDINRNAGGYNANMLRTGQSFGGKGYYLGGMLIDRQLMRGMLAKINSKHDLLPLVENPINNEENEENKGNEEIKNDGLSPSNQAELVSILNTKIENFTEEVEQKESDSPEISIIPKNLFSRFDQGAKAVSFGDKKIVNLTKTDDITEIKKKTNRNIVADKSDIDEWNSMNEILRKFEPENIEYMSKKSNNDHIIDYDIGYGIVEDM